MIIGKVSVSVSPCPGSTGSSIVNGTSTETVIMPSGASMTLSVPASRVAGFCLMAPLPAAEGCHEESVKAEAAKADSATLAPPLAAHQLTVNNVSGFLAR